MPWEECHAVDERFRFVARLLDSEKMAVLCAEFGIARTTGSRSCSTSNLEWEIPTRCSRGTSSN